MPTTRNIYGARELTGGGFGALDAIDTTGLEDQSFAYCLTDETLFLYVFDADSALDEASPDRIKPDSGPGCWLRVELTPAVLDGDTVEVYQGTAIRATAGETLVLGDLCYRGLDKKYWKTDADSTAAMPGSAVCTETIAADERGIFLLLGLVRKDDWAWTPGALLFASTDAGGMTHTIPVGGGDQIQVVGLAYTETIVMFNPAYILAEMR